MQMLRSVWVPLVLCLFASGPALAAHAPAAADRGFLSLAWDAHETGLFEEALSYLAEIGVHSPVAAEATSLKAECLFDLDRYAEAVQVLESAGAASLPDREPFLIDVFWEWIWEATSREDYADALSLKFFGAGRGFGDAADGGVGVDASDLLIPSRTSPPGTSRRQRERPLRPQQ